MDLTHLTPTSTTAAAIGKPPPESESETPPAKFHPTKPTSYNGVLKRHAPPSLASLKYKECLKNHAASMGGHALDGCGEFMSSGTNGDPASLKCAACGCHRNFHRRDSEFDSPPLVSPILEYHPHHRHHPPPPHGTRESLSPPPISSAYFPGSGSAPHMLLGLALSEPSRRKRFRTKFSHEQKEKMLEIAEKIGWKMQKINEDTVRRFCSEVGVERGVFKVWMHNNKNASAKRVADPSERNGIRNGNEGNSHSSSIEQQDQDHDQDHNHHHHLCNGKSNAAAATIASSSSS